jgi:NADPH-dependent 2,4-dienoyl-CoA reductase/sulfur reductase-like enzyme
MSSAWSPSASDRVVIVGAGQAGARAAEGLRAAGHVGSIALIGEERHIPYERPQLSKETLLRPEAPVVPIRGESAWSEIGVDLHTGRPAIECDAKRRAVRLSDGQTFEYDRLLLATGVRPRRIETLENRSVPVFYLRTIDDALALRSALHPGSCVVIVGGGVIGLETAAAAVAAGCSVTIVEAAPSLLQRALPRLASDFLLRRHSAAGVSFRFDCLVESIDGGDLILSDGSRMAADLVIVGIGATPNVSVAERLGVCGPEGIRVDGYGRTSAPGVFAVGDVTSQWDERRRRWRRLETWANAQNQAIAVARAMVGPGAPYCEPVWFWSDQYDFNIQVVGELGEGDLICRGDPQSDRFTLVSCEDGVVRGGATINRRPDMAALRKLVAAGSAVNRSKLADPSVDLRKIVH